MRAGRRNCRWPWFLTVLAVGAVIGCVHIGPNSIMEDRLAYNEALATTWKEQTLLNIVKLRYTDTPFFVDVAQIVAGYTMANTVGADATVVPDSSTTTFSQLLGAGLSFQRGFSDRPTISYAPQNNSARFIQNLTLPLPPSAVLYLMQAGYPVDLIFDLTLDSINGVRNRVVAGTQVSPVTPEFRRVGQILRQAQQSGHIGMRIELDKEKKESLVMTIRSKAIESELEQDLNELRTLLKMPEGISEFRVVYGAVPRSPNEIAMVTRSAVRILTNLATMVDVPVKDLAIGRAPDLGPLADGGNQRLMVHSGPKRPCDCFAAVCYRGSWFWIDDCDIESKRTMAYLMIILALADAGVKEPVPFLTIQAN